MTSTMCPRCKAIGLKPYNMRVHFLCSYVGPDYDFKSDGAKTVCPKCNHALKANGDDWEIVGRLHRCETCLYEVSE